MSSSRHLKKILLNHSGKWRNVFVLHDITIFNFIIRLQNNIEVIAFLVGRYFKFLNVCSYFVGAVNSGCRSRRSGRHARVPFTATQAAALEAAYSRAAYLAPPALRALAAALQLRDDRVSFY